MILKNSPFSIKNRKRGEIDYIKSVYKERIQSEIDTYFDQEKDPDTIKVQDILYIDKVSI